MPCCLFIWHDWESLAEVSPYLGLGLGERWILELQCAYGCWGTAQGRSKVQKDFSFEKFFMWPMDGGSLAKAQTRSTVSIRAWVSFRVRRVTNPRPPVWIKLQGSSPEKLSLQKDTSPKMCFCLAHDWGALAKAQHTPCIIARSSCVWDLGETKHKAPM